MRLSRLRKIYQFRTAPDGALAIVCSDAVPTFENKERFTLFRVAAKLVGGRASPARIPN